MGCSGVVKSPDTIVLRRPCCCSTKSALSKHLRPLLCRHDTLAFLSGNCKEKVTPAGQRMLRLIERSHKHSRPISSAIYSYRRRSRCKCCLGPTPLHPRMQLPSTSIKGTTRYRHMCVFLSAEQCSSGQVARVTPLQEGAEIAWAACHTWQ